MHLKILLVPFMIIMMLVLAIGYIQPDFVLMQQKRAEIETKQLQVNDMETLLSNIDSLSGSLDTQRDSENFILNYLPRSMDQGRVIDALNYSALQAGVSIETIEAHEPAEQVAATQTDISGAEVPAVSPVLNPDGTPMLNPDGTPVTMPTPPKVKTYVGKVIVRGSYENIKNFLNRVAHINRYYELHNFFVGLSKEDLESPSSDVIQNGLVGSFEADFNFVGIQKAQSALNLDIFKRSQLDLAPLQGILSWVTQQVPGLEKPPTGKTNPFQQ